MKKWILYFLAIILGVSAEAGTKAKFSLEPLTSTVLNLTNNAVELVSYRVTNNTKITRTLTFEPHDGLIQYTVGAGLCPSPFTLAYGDSCILTLIATTENAVNSQVGGPIVCKTNSISDTSANPFLCSRPSASAALHINIPSRPTGAVYCWGQNDFSQLGREENADTFNANPNIEPTALSATNIVQVSGGYVNTCALDADGLVYCWGDNSYGQLGLNGVNQGIWETIMPIQIAGLSGKVRKIVTGTNFNCALMYDGAVQCWGQNDDGESGNPDLTSDVIIPNTVNLTERALQLSAGGAHSCALLPSKRVACWGANYNGQLGNTVVDNKSAEPVFVENLKDVVNVVVGTDHSCALTKDAEIWCWGNNEKGQLGNPNIGKKNPTPMQVDPGLLNGTPIAISAGAEISCALMSDKTTVQCWGANEYGQLGNGLSNNIPNSMPSLVVALAGPVDRVIPTSWNTCFLLSDGRMQCAGINRWGTNGNATNSGNNNPNPTPDFVDNLNNTLSPMITPGADHFCVVK
jgi:alpha-tubulin suppressor-like RCC1 family protein